MTKNIHDNLVESDEFGVWKLTKDNLLKENYAKVRINSFTLLKQGELRFSINGLQYSLMKNNITVTTALSEPELVSATDDIIAYIVIFGKKMIEKATHGKKMISFEYIKELLNIPLIYLTDKETNLLAGNMKRMQNMFLQKDHLFRKEIMQEEFSIFLLELGNIIINKQKDNDHPVSRNPANRKENIIVQFAILVANNFKEQHQVGFYADKLCISAQYLARIIKELSGKTVYEWIAEKLVEAAKTSLATSDKSVQQIADELHFSDQAAFGKFFKKHIGTSPALFRKKG